MLRFETFRKRKLPEVKKAVSGKGGRESRKAEGRAQKLAAKRRRESWLKEGGGGTFCR